MTPKKRISSYSCCVFQVASGSAAQTAALRADTSSTTDQMSSGMPFHAGNVPSGIQPTSSDESSGTALPSSQVPSALPGDVGKKSDPPEPVTILDVPSTQESQSGNESGVCCNRSSANG